MYIVNVAYMYTEIPNHAIDVLSVAVVIDLERYPEGVYSLILSGN